MKRWVTMPYLDEGYPSARFVEIPTGAWVHWTDAQEEIAFALDTFRALLAGPLSADQRAMVEMAIARLERNGA